MGGVKEEMNWKQWVCEQIAVQLSCFGYIIMVEKLAVGLGLMLIGLLYLKVVIDDIKVETPK